VATRSKKRKPKTDEEWDLASFERLPELRPLKEGATFAIFFKRVAARASGPPRKKPMAEITSAGPKAGRSRGEYQRSNL
jgi:hypothetical protein